MQAHTGIIFPASPKAAMPERVHVREIFDEESNQLLRLVRPNGGSVMTWRRIQTALLSA